MNDSEGAVPSVTRSPAMTAAIYVVFAQGVGLLGLAAWLCVMALTQAETSMGAGFAEAAIALGVGVLLIAAGRSMSRGRSGLRGATIFVELLLLPLGYYMAQADLWGFAIATWVIGAGTVGLLVMPSARHSVGLD